ncbi:hypothetical protein [Halosimplex halophilum]|uniref:hypothetical protein n=1 Tax=Halosimplex halophilum TaxID=2559572 RepID=UPI00107F634D|nr:hypothetical protein [Halosimplex halophilum]
MGLREATALLTDHEPNAERSLSVRPGVVPNDRTELDLTERLFDLFGLVGYDPDRESSTEVSASVASALRVFVDLRLTITNGGVEGFPGSGTPASTTRGGRAAERADPGMTFVSWIESHRRESPSPDDSERQLPVKYGRALAPVPEDTAGHCAIGVYRLEEDQADNRGWSATRGDELSVETPGHSLVEGDEGVELWPASFASREERHVFVHPDVGAFDVSPYARLHDRYADDLRSLLVGLDMSPLAYPELVSMDGDTTAP